MMWPVVGAKCWSNTVATRHRALPVTTFKSFLSCVDFCLVRPVQQGLGSHGRVLGLDMVGERTGPSPLEAISFLQHQ